MESDDEANKKDKTLKEFDATISKIQNDILENESSIKKVEKEKSELEAQKASEAKNREKITEKLSSLEKNKNKEEGERARLNGEINKLQAEIDDLTQKINNQKVNKEDLKRINELEGDIAGIDGKISNGSKLLKDNKEAIDKTEEEIKENKRKSLRLKELDENLAKVKKDINNYEEQVKVDIAGQEAKVKKAEEEVKTQRQKTNDLIDKINKNFGLKIPKTKEKEEKPKAKEKTPENKGKTGKNKASDKDSGKKTSIVSPKKKEIQKQIILLEVAVSKNKVAVKSAEFLLENAPKQIAPVKDKLIRQIEKAKKIIEKSEKLLERAKKIEA